MSTQKFQTNSYNLSPSDLTGLDHYVKSQGWLAHNEKVLAVTKAGEGNMNCVLRASTLQKSFILKQSLPWVEKYPQIKAPQDRILVEARFYELTKDSLSHFMPKLLGIDPVSRIAAFEDLGASRDYLALYQGEILGTDDLAALLDFLSNLHALKITREDLLRNQEMRKLNHDHLFVIPLTMSDHFKNDTAYNEAVAKLGQLYLSNGNTLLHGDFYPGSWLKTREGLKIIDPEFCFLGCPEFDLGVLAAHLFLANQPAQLLTQVLKNYRGTFDAGLTLRFCGVEIMRRLLGVAKLPLTLSDEKQKELLKISRGLVVSTS